jgi:membrane protein involved in colicin uptake
MGGMHNFCTLPASIKAPSHLNLDSPGSNRLRTFEEKAKREQERKQAKRQQQQEQEKERRRVLEQRQVEEHAKEEARVARRTVIGTCLGAGTARSSAAKSIYHT